MKTLSQHGPRFVKPGDRPLLLMTLIVPFHVLVSGPDSLFRAIFDEQGIPAWLGKPNAGARQPSESIVWQV